MQLVEELGAQMKVALPMADVTPVAGDALELAFSGERRDELDQALATLGALWQTEADIDGEHHRIDVALGGAAVPARAFDEVRLIEEAEVALAESLSERRPVTREVGAGLPFLDRRTLADELSLAIDRDELFLQYQPKLHVRRQCIASVEALIRWRHPTRGLILPSDFIPAAEASSIILPLTLWTIRRAIDDQRRLLARGHELRVFINIAGVLLGDPHFVRCACKLVEESGARLGFEVTETSVIRDPEGAIANLNAFADIGITIAIDDYGAGLSSLAYLKQLPARELKIDKLFVTQLTSSNRDPLIVRSTIDLAHAMEMEVVAEGVETRASLALLSVMGCDMAQGYLICRPVEFDALVSYLDEERHLAASQQARITPGSFAPFHQRCG